MPLLVTPRHLNQRAELYYQLHALTAAGVGLPRALETLRRSPPARSQRPGLSQLIAHLDSGSTFAEALDRITPRIPAFDVALLQASEISGRLDAGFRLLAEHYREYAGMIRGAISDLLYPLLLLHAAVFLFPFANAFLSGQWANYLARTLGPLAALYGAVFALLLACQGSRGEAWRGRLEQISRAIPLLGSTRRAWAIARLAAALEALISAGVPIIEGWTYAAAASGSPALRRTVRSWQNPLLAGRTPGELVEESPEFPELFSSQYRTGEISGKLDETLVRLHTYYADEAARHSRALAQWVPRMIYFIIAGFIAYRVVSFYTNYFAQINQLL
jgi:type II secretory pathway component PulF